MDAALTHILTTWGAPGAIIVLLTGLLGFMVRQFQSERKDMRVAHAEERDRQFQYSKEQREEQARLIAENTAQNRATEQVLRELTGLLGRIEGQTRNH